MKHFTVQYPLGAWSHQPITPRKLYRRLRTAARLEHRGELSAYLARQMRIHAIADAMGCGINVDRIYLAALHPSQVQVTQ